MICENITETILDGEYELIFRGTDEECDKVMWANYHPKGIFDYPKWNMIHKGKFISGDTDVDFVFTSRVQPDHTKEKPHILQYLYRHKDFNKKPNATLEKLMDIRDEIGRKILKLPEQDCDERWEYQRLINLVDKQADSVRAEIVESKREESDKTQQNMLQYVCSIFRMK